MQHQSDVIIIGGSYAGLSAAMALGRALRRVVVIDSERPCNMQTPHSHNFITHDGDAPAAISALAKEQVMRYPTVRFVRGLATSGRRHGDQFEITTNTEEIFMGRKVLFATGMKDIMPSIRGFSECWGKSVLHCPYCHGYEVRNELTGIIGNGDLGFEFARLIHHWTKRLTLFTNGPSSLTALQNDKLKSHGIGVVETAVEEIVHDNGFMSAIRLAGNKELPLRVVYSRPVLEQHCAIPSTLGCELTEQNLLKVDAFQRTTINGLYAAGDATTMMRSVSLAVASGGFAGASINKDLIEQEF